MKTFSKKMSAILAVLVLSLSLVACDGLGENDDEDTNGLLDGILESNEGGDAEEVDSSDSGNLDEDEEPTSEGPDGPPRK